MSFIKLLLEFLGQHQFGFNINFNLGFSKNPQEEYETTDAVSSGDFGFARHLNEVEQEEYDDNEDE